MIRTSLPIPPAEQFRLRLELAARRTRRALEQRRRDLRFGAETALRVATTAPRVLHDNYLRVRWQEELKLERATFNDFYNHYDSLIGLLCLAAHEGNSADIEADYKEKRTFFMSRYPKIKQYVAPHLEIDTNDTLQTLWGRRACDAFEAMFSSTTVGTLLETDNGHLIERMVRANTALADWEGDLEKRETTASR
ncbi:MAG: hypothetical protein H7145_14015 [Akkermansiaceae bacterium]|nr:hypothetical protein [Armatimonadota bacterium]